MFYPNLKDGHQHGGRKPTKTSVTEFCYKRVNLSLEELKNVTMILYSNTRTVQIAECKGYVTQKLRNSSVVCHKTKNPFGVKICMNSSFHVLLYIMKVKSQEVQ